MSSSYDITSFLTFHCTQLNTSSTSTSPSSQCNRCYDTTNSDAGRLVQINIPPCQHVMCVTCLTDHINRGHHTCPFCRTIWWALDPNDEDNGDDSSTGALIVTPWSSPALSPIRWSSSEPREHIALDNRSNPFETPMWIGGYTIETASDSSFSDDGIWSLQPRWTWTIGRHTVGLLGFRATLRAFCRTIVLMRSQRRRESSESIRSTHGGSETQSGSTMFSYGSAIDSPNPGAWNDERGERLEEAERLGDHMMEI